jgi:hypothetical protein
LIYGQFTDAFDNVWVVHRPTSPLVTSVVIEVERRNGSPGVYVVIPPGDIDKLIEALNRAKEGGPI